MESSTNSNEEIPLDLSSSSSIRMKLKKSKDAGTAFLKSSDSTEVCSVDTISVPLLRTRAKTKSLLPCSVCGKCFDRPSLLKRHMRTHTGEKPHICDICNKGFSTSSSLNTHRRIHSGEKPHQCPICGKRFTASSNLYYHRMTHNKEKPHKCSLCGKSFPTPGDLKSHQYVHSGCWPFTCSICKRGFSKQTNLRNHLLLHSGEKPHSCTKCGKKFALSCNLRAHIKIHNNETTSRSISGIHNSIVSKNSRFKWSKRTVASLASKDPTSSSSIESTGKFSVDPTVSVLVENDTCPIPYLYPSCNSDGNIPLINFTNDGIQNFIQQWLISSKYYKEISSLLLQNIHNQNVVENLQNSYPFVENQTHCYNPSQRNIVGENFRNYTSTFTQESSTMLMSPLKDSHYTWSTNVLQQ